MTILGGTGEGECMYQYMYSFARVVTCAYGSSDLARTSYVMETGDTSDAMVTEPAEAAPAEPHANAAAAMEGVLHAAGIVVKVVQLEAASVRGEVYFLFVRKLHMLLEEGLLILIEQCFCASSFLWPV